MHEKIEKVAVLGSGIMGAQIAGHLANAGIESYLLISIRNWQIKAEKAYYRLSLNLYTIQNI